MSGNWIKKLFQTDSQDSHEKLLYIQAAILRELSARIRPLPGGRAHFPATHLTIQLFAGSDEQQLDYEKTFRERQSLEKKLREELHRQGAEQDAAQLVITIEVVRRKDGAWKERGFNLVARLERRGAAAATLVIQRGQAEAGEYRLGPRTNIGRTREPPDSQGRIIRRNEVAFADLRDGINETVSRLHARIELDASSDEYRIYDDDSRGGTRIERDGDLIPVEGPRGTVLQDGDLLYFGKALARFSFDESRIATGR